MINVWNRCATCLEYNHVKNDIIWSAFIENLECAHLASFALLEEEKEEEKKTKMNTDENAHNVRYFTILKIKTTTTTTDPFHKGRFKTPHKH